MSSFAVVSTFSGCGGSSFGYKMAGGKVLLAVEWDNNAVETYKANFPNTPVYHGDISKLSVEEILSRIDLNVGELDILDGSPPCQGFSTAGKRDFTDNRNQLFKEYCRLLEGLQPKVFVMENVSGMVKGKMKIAFVEILKTLKGCGYQVSAKLLNAKYFGVPQSRERMIFIGVRKDLKIQPSHPNGNGRIISVAEALRGCKPSETPAFNDKYAQLWPRVPLGKNASHVIGKGFNNCVKLDPNRPSCTLPKMQTGRGFATIAHWKEPRAISIAEAKRLASFPDEYVFLGSYAEQWARIGNCVPPLFMKAIAGHIRDHILMNIASMGISLSSAK